MLLKVHPWEYPQYSNSPFDICRLFIDICLDRSIGVSSQKVLEGNLKNKVIAGINVYILKPCAYSNAQNCITNLITKPE